MSLSSPTDADADKLIDHNSNPASTNAFRSIEPTPHQPDSLEFSAPLENSVPLEAPRAVHRAPRNPPAVVPTAPQAVVPRDKQIGELSSDPHHLIEHDRLDLNAIAPPLEAVVEQSAAPKPTGAEVIIPLLQERLVIDRRRRKVGEVVVRKEIETYIIEVPVRREKLIVEQVSPAYKQLAVVDLGETQTPESNSSNDPLPPTIDAKFTSAAAAIEFIEAIAAQSTSGLTTVNVGIVLADEGLQKAYQQWLEQPDYQQWLEQHST